MVNIYSISWQKWGVFCFILAGSCQIFVQACPKKNLTGNFFWETFLFGQCPCFFFLPFWNLWNQHRRNVCVYFFPRFSMQWTWMWASLRTTPPGATKVSECFWKWHVFFFTGNKPRERERRLDIYGSSLFFPLVYREKWQGGCFFFGGAALNEMFSPGTLPLTRIGAVLGNKPLLARRRWVGWIRDASVIKNMGNVSKLFFFWLQLPVINNTWFWKDNSWQGMRGCTGGGQAKPKIWETNIQRNWSWSYFSLHTWEFYPPSLLIPIMNHVVVSKIFSFHPETLGRFHPICTYFFHSWVESWNQPPNTHENSFREFGTRNTWHLHQAGSWGLVPCSTPDFSWLANHRREVSPAGGASEVSLPWPRIWKSCRGWDWLDGTWVRYTR